MLDDSRKLRKGEKRVIEGFASAESGTLLIDSDTVVCAFYDAEGVVVPDFDTSAPGFDEEAAEMVRVWFELATTTLDAGFYVLTLFFKATNSEDDIEREYAFAFAIQILEASG